MHAEPILKKKRKKKKKRNKLDMPVTNEVSETITFETGENSFRLAAQTSGRPLQKKQGQNGFISLAYHNAPVRVWQSGVHTLLRWIQ